MTLLIQERIKVDYQMHLYNFPPVLTGTIVFSTKILTQLENQLLLDHPRQYDRSHLKMLLCKFCYILFWEWGEYGRRSKPGHLGSSEINAVLHFLYQYALKAHT